MHAHEVCIDSSRRRVPAELAFTWAPALQLENAQVYYSIKLMHDIVHVDVDWCMHVQEHYF